MTLLEQQTQEFFSFLVKTLNEWNDRQLNPQNIKTNIIEDIDNLQNTENKNTNDIQNNSNQNTDNEKNDNETTTIKKNWVNVEKNKKDYTFIEYFCLKLYFNFGIRRKFYKYGPEFTEDEIKENSKLSKIYGKSRNVLYQFFYDKKINKYNKGNPIVQLCRHMLFDLNSMSIVSIGVTKAIDYDKFMNNLKLNINLNEKKDYSQKIIIEEFLEGTMVIYNPFASQFNFTKIIEKSNSTNNLDDDNDSDSNNETDTTSENTSYASKLISSSKKITTENNNENTSDNSNNSSESSTGNGIESNTESNIESNENNSTISVEKIEKKYNFEISTRKIIGTSYFNNPKITFQDMFYENNKNQNIDLEKLKSLKNHSFVFNVQHKENRVIAPKSDNCNTLVGCFKFKELSKNKNHFDSFTKYLLEANCDNDKSFSYKMLEKLGQNLSQNSITPINLKIIKESLTDIEIKIPKVVKEIVINKKYEFEDLEKLIKDEIDSQSKFTPGLMIKDNINNIRTKFRNEDYSFLLEIKGSKPIGISESNKEYLFKLYWKLRQKQNKNIITFLKNFDTSEKDYAKIFDWYKKCIHTMTNKLHQEYLATFVKKTKTFQDIPYDYKPLCLELHKLYTEDKTYINNYAVINFVNKLPYNKMYWRLFGAKNNYNKPQLKKNKNNNNSSNDFNSLNNPEFLMDNPNNKKQNNKINKEIKDDIKNLINKETANNMDSENNKINNNNEINNNKS